ncbi:MAG: hypothetical protein V4447_10775 [Pseudomonadota bacterium]
MKILKNLIFCIAMAFGMSAHASNFYEAVLLNDQAAVYNTIGEFDQQLAYYYGPIYPQGALRWDFVWSATSMAADDGGINAIKPTSIPSGSPGRWLQNSSTYSGPQVSADFLIPFGPGHVKNKPLTKRGMTDTSGNFTWTFSKPFPSGVTPIIGITPEDNTSGVFISHKVTSISNTSVTIQVARQTAVTVLGISVLGIATNAATNVSLTAANPTD